MNDVPTLELMGMDVARIDGGGLLDHIFDALSQRRGGWLVTANLDILRRFSRQPEVRALYQRADLRIADGMPLIWGAQLRGQPLPERLAGSSLIWSIAERAARTGRSIYLLGGAPGSAQGTERRFRERYPGIDICGLSAPRVDSPPSEPQVQAIRNELVRIQPDILLVGLGSPKQEQIIDALTDALPHTWMIGVGISFSFVAGQVRRAPHWMRRCGLEWLHRLGQEPVRLFRRYLVDDAPFALRLFVQCLLDRGNAER
jgi:N-acetylglucosaminyldiphosphoundecaprenol N-acetyl-beta-D-mannosaminyltransferase